MISQRSASMVRTPNSQTSKKDARPQKKQQQNNFRTSAPIYSNATIQPIHSQEETNSYVAHSINSNATQQETTKPIHSQEETNSFVVHSIYSNATEQEEITFAKPVFGSATPAIILRSNRSLKHRGEQRKRKMYDTRTFQEILPLLQITNTGSRYFQLLIGFSEEAKEYYGVDLDGESLSCPKDDYQYYVTNATRYVVERIERHGPKHCLVKYAGFPEVELQLLTNELKQLL